MMFTVLLAALLGCTTRVAAVSTNATDTVKIIRGGPMPQEGQPIQGVPVTQGKGQAMGTTTYVLGRRFWVVAENDEGMSVVQIRNKAKGGGIAGCAAGTLLLGPFLGSPWACLYVSGPGPMTQINSPSAE